jgi:hypothetical protein
MTELVDRSERLLVKYPLFKTAVARVRACFDSYETTAEPDCCPIVGECQGRSEKEPLGRSKRGPLWAVVWGRVICVLGPAGAEPCEAGGRALRAERRPAPKRMRVPGGLSAYVARSAARFRLLSLSR